MCASPQVGFIMILQLVLGKLCHCEMFFSTKIDVKNPYQLSAQIQCQGCILALCRFKMVVSLKHRFSKQTPLESAATLKARELT